MACISMLIGMHFLSIMGNNKLQTTKQFVCRNNHRHLMNSVIGFFRINFNQKYEILYISSYKINTDKSLTLSIADKTTWIK